MITKKLSRYLYENPLIILPRRIYIPTKHENNNSDSLSKYVFNNRTWLYPSAYTKRDNERKPERERGDRERERDSVLLSFQNFNDRILLHWQMKDKKINDKRTRGKK